MIYGDIICSKIRTIWNPVFIIWISVFHTSLLPQCCSRRPPPPVLRSIAQTRHTPAFRQFLPATTPRPCHFKSISNMIFMYFCVPIHRKTRKHVEFTTKEKHSTSGVIYQENTCIKTFVIYDTCGVLLIFLIHLPLNKMSTLLKTTFSNVFSGGKNILIHIWLMFVLVCLEDKSNSKSLLYQQPPCKKYNRGDFDNVGYITLHYTSQLGS